MDVETAGGEGGGGGGWIGSLRLVSEGKLLHSFNGKKLNRKSTKVRYVGICDAIFNFLEPKRNSLNTDEQVSDVRSYDYSW